MNALVLLGVACIAAGLSLAAYIAWQIQQMPAVQRARIDADYKTTHQTQIGTPNE